MNTPPRDIDSVTACGSVLTVNLSAIERNYHTISQQVGKAEVSAVVKANAYGLGMEAVAPALERAGCRTFFVAMLDEGIAVRHTLPDATIYILHGVRAGEESQFLEHRLSPVLGSLDELTRWEAQTSDIGAALHIDTGMHRLGISMEDAGTLLGDHTRLGRTNIHLLMSHLACGGEQTHIKNQRQQRDFATLRAQAPHIPACFANSAGCFMGDDFHFDMVRPGGALYGLRFSDLSPYPTEQAITLSASILHSHTLHNEDSVGYAATCTLPKGARVAVMGMGYSDGFPRLLSNKGQVFIEGHAVPVVGTVTMDMTILDVSHLPKALTLPGTMVEIIGPNQTPAQLAETAGIIDYELMTRMGHRVTRIYTHGQKASL